MKFMLNEVADLDRVLHALADSGRRLALEQPRASVGERAWTADKKTDLRRNDGRAFCQSRHLHPAAPLPGSPRQELDFRVGGHERFGGLTPDGTPYRYEGLYYDIVPDHRIVYSYEMYAGADRMSVSLATVEIAPDPDGTRLTYTEQGAFLDGLEKPREREEGTAFILDNLGNYLASHAHGWKAPDRVCNGPRPS